MNLECRAPGVTLITGSNGCGKTMYLQQQAQQHVVNGKFLAADALRQPMNAHVRSWLKQAIALEDGPIKRWLDQVLNTRGWTSGETLNERLEAIQPAKCSSGQLRLLWMILAVSVGVPDYGKVLIDEGEQSLHVGWQRRLVWEFEELAKLRHLSIVISTHSVVLIDDAWEWVISMDGTR